MFATDRDLLVLEPMLFHDVRWPSQRVVRGRCMVVQTALALESLDISFEDGQVDAGGVIVVGATPLEVVRRLDAKKLLVSRVRPIDRPPIPVGSIVDECLVTTFAAQLDQVHRTMLRMAGLSARDMPIVLNPEDARAAHALGALSLIFLAASNGAGTDHPHAQRAVMYQKRFEAECERVTLVLDTNNDGIADSSRRLAGGPMVRG
ncbi:MAG: hypothetical protein NTV94_04250 [Planctomycetota bacterium]|nr:hypothetical protein [Planctomycetota bacterium]